VIKRGSYVTRDFRNSDSILSAQRIITGFFLTLILLGQFSQTDARKSELKDAVVKIFTVYNEYDYYRPWQMKGKQSKTGSGCIISGNRILTNAHVVADQTFIQVKRAGQPDKFVAKVAYVGHDCDLAILTVPDKAFFENTRPVSIGELPRMQDKVSVYGFPQGGTKIAITQGVVSRVEHQNYSHSRAGLLCCQIDAPINSGSSGGPVISGGKIAGISFQSSSGENIGYMVPAPVVKHFLADIEDGTFDGFPSLVLSWQTMENPDIRKRFNMPADESGVLVTRLFPHSPAQGHLEKDDIILSINDKPIANDGTIEFRPDERTHFSYAYQQQLMGETARLTVLRNGQKQNLSFPLTWPSNRSYLVPGPFYDTPPRYFIFGGFVFSPMTFNFLKSWGNRWFNSAPKQFMGYVFSEPDTTDREVLVLSQILSDESNVGYDDFHLRIITAVNNEPVHFLEDLIQKVDTASTEFIEFKAENGDRIVISRKEALDTKARIFSRYRIVFDRSTGTPEKPE